MTISLQLQRSSHQHFWMVSKKENPKDSPMNARRPALFRSTLGGAALLLTTMSAFLVYAQDTRTPMVITLDKALEIAARQNRDIQVADQDRLKADAQITEARSGAFPQLNVSALYTRNIKNAVMFVPPNSLINPSSKTMTVEFGSANAYSAGATLTQPLFNWRVGVAMDIANTYSNYADRAYQATQEDVALQTKKAFYTALLMRELVRANHEGLEVVRANFENVRAQFTNGTAAEFDLLRAEVQVANTEPLFIAAENSLLLAKNNLKNVLALPLDQEIDVQGELKYQDIQEEVLELRRREAIATNSTIAQLALQESLLNMNISVERAAHYPTLDLTGSYQWQSQDNTFIFKDYLWANSFNFGLKLSFPLFDGFKASARTEEAIIDHQKIVTTRQKAEEGLRLRIQSFELRMADAKKRIEGQEKSLGQAQKAVQIAQTRFKSGVGTQLELMDTQVAMTRTQTNFAQAIYDYLVARAEWENAVGQTR
jgi:outer membrane protein